MRSVRASGAGRIGSGRLGLRRRLLLGGTVCRGRDRPIGVGGIGDVTACRQCQRQGRQQDRGPDGSATGVAGLPRSCGARRVLPPEHGASCHDATLPSGARRDLRMHPPTVWRIGNFVDLDRSVRCRPGSGRQPPSRIVTAAVLLAPTTGRAGEPGTVSGRSSGARSMTVTDRSASLMATAASMPGKRSCARVSAR